MRGARLLQCLLLLQNRGRQTARDLARELEVSPRTILRDVDAMTEAGLPIIVHRGPQGGIELGFDYRTRLTGLTAGEAEALGILLGRPPREAEALGLGREARQALAKLTESLPEPVRNRVQSARRRHPVEVHAPDPDPRIAALARAIRDGRTVTLAMRSKAPIRIHPERLGFDGHNWWIEGRDGEARVSQADWGDINISRH